MQTPFTLKIYEIARRIPKGKVATYGQLAALAGNAKAARAVGMAMRHNPDVPKTPCHRVVGAGGALIGYSAGMGIHTKRKMLEAEGVAFNGIRVNLLKSQWHPNRA